MDTKIPIVFAFDDLYALPASIAIQSLLDSKKPETEYDIFVLHGDLSPETVKKINQIADISWISIDDDIFAQAPYNSKQQIVAYYRLLLADLIPQYDKIIWSDVDVLFIGDLKKIFQMDMGNAYWAGVIAEKNKEDEKGVHTRFEENKKKIYICPAL